LGQSVNRRESLCTYVYLRKALNKRKTKSAALLTSKLNMDTLTPPTSRVTWNNKDYVSEKKPFNLAREKTKEHCLSHRRTGLPRRTNSTPAFFLLAFRGGRVGVECHKLNGPRAPLERTQPHGHILTHTQPSETPWTLQTVLIKTSTTTKDEESKKQL